MRSLGFALGALGLEPWEVITQVGKASSVQIVASNRMMFSVKLVMAKPSEKLYQEILSKENSLVLQLLSSKLITDVFTFIKRPN